MNRPLFFLSIFMSMCCFMNVFAEEIIIDDRRTGSISSNLGEEWRLVTDQVMGGVSIGSLSLDKYLGRDCLRMKGQVSTQNNGGFLQIALDLMDDKNFDASGYDGIILEIAGNNEKYNLHFRTDNLWLPWQSYRSSFVARNEWSSVKIPFKQIIPHRTSSTFRKDKIKRIGLVAIGRNFEADLCVGLVKLYGAKDINE